VLGHEDVPRPSAIFTVPVAYLVELFVVRVGLIGSEPAGRGNRHGGLQFLLFLPLLEVLEGFEYIGDSLVLSAQFLLAFLHLLPYLAGLCLLLAYSLPKTAIFDLQPIDLLLQPLKLKRKDGLRV
jgi:hypothetical protein